MVELKAYRTCPEGLHPAEQSYRERFAVDVITKILIACDLGVLPVFVKEMPHVMPCAQDHSKVHVCRVIFVAAHGAVLVGSLDHCT